MKEDFLHYVWKFQKFTSSHLTTVAGETVQVVSPGQHNFNAGPDFLNAQLVIDGQLWAGNVELHLKSSDWYAHQHHDDEGYDSVLLHVVWEYNVAVFRANDTVIPTLELKQIVKPAAKQAYLNLIDKQATFIKCEQEFPSIDTFIVDNWLERMYLERLQQKTETIYTGLDKGFSHWEALLFQQLSKNFGLKVNGDSFLSIANSVPFSVVQKCKDNVLTLEALLFGQAGLLQKKVEDDYIKNLQNEYAFLQKKFKLTNQTVVTPKFFRLRPPNFPTIRLSQLAVLYSKEQHLFSRLIEATTKEKLYAIFEVKASSYWNSHFNFGTTSPQKEKRLTKNFIDLLLINTVIPFKFCYAKYQGRDNSEALLDLAASISAEKNTIVSYFNTLKPIAKNAMHTQALLHLKRHYCDNHRCLQCTIGIEILSKN